MPTFDKTRRFERDLDRLSADQKLLFKKAVEGFVEDLRSSPSTFRKGLRVKGVRGARGVFEMTWDNDGRATFEYGDPVQADEPHIIWRRIGTHTILKEP
ncbi:MAG: hypothetical protein ACK5PP_13625 [Acidimicrobiales bacterium]